MAVPLYGCLSGCPFPVGCCREAHTNWLPSRSQCATVALTGYVFPNVAQRLVKDSALGTAQPVTLMSSRISADSGQLAVFAASRLNPVRFDGGDISPPDGLRHQ